MPDGRGSPERGPTRVHTVRLALSDYEWDVACDAAKETGISVDLLLSLVVAFCSRAHIHHAACLALADITRPYHEQVQGILR